jgi:hypothetical protein
VAGRSTTSGGGAQTAPWSRADEARVPTCAHRLCACLQACLLVAATGAWPGCWDFSRLCAAGDCDDAAVGDQAAPPDAAPPDAAPPADGFRGHPDGIAPRDLTPNCQTSCDGGTCCGGYCTDTSSDPAHCGACGQACAAGSACCSGTCIDIANDVANCGACGAACPPMNDIPSCSAGLCGVSSCTPGWRDCNMNGADGCEQYVLGNDIFNCGGCGFHCNGFNVVGPGCASGVCTGTCASGWGDCDHTLVDGCEAHLDVDVGNCGACRNTCPAHGQMCVNGQCKCPNAMPDYCNSGASPYCTDFTTDPSNCGLCGTMCTTCVAGICN